MFTACLYIDGKSHVVGFYPSEAEAFLEAQRAWERWIKNNVRKEDEETWLESGYEPYEFGPKVIS